MREDLLKQFSSADAHNPLADFKAGTVSAIGAPPSSRTSTCAR